MSYNESFEDFHKKTYKKFYDLFKSYGINYREEVGQKEEYLPFLLERFILLDNRRTYFQQDPEGNRFDPVSSDKFIYELIVEICYKLFELELKNRKLENQINYYEGLDLFIDFVKKLKEID